MDTSRQKAAERFRAAFGAPASNGNTVISANPALTVKSGCIFSPITGSVPALRPSQTTSAGNAAKKTAMPRPPHTVASSKGAATKDGNRKYGVMPGAKIAQTIARPASQSHEAIAPARPATSNATAKTPKPNDNRSQRGWAKEGSAWPEIHAAII